MQALIDDLLSRSPSFSSYWKEHAVLNREGGERCFKHPSLGVRRFLQTTLTVTLQPDYKLVCLAPMIISNND
jgi:hypothetical protein